MLLPFQVAIATLKEEPHWKVLPEFNAAHNYQSLWAPNEKLKGREMISREPDGKNG